MALAQEASAPLAPELRASLLTLNTPGHNELHHAALAASALARTYAAVVHQRFTVGWRGRRAAILSIIAFLSVLFTLWGVSFLLEGVHSYAA